MGWTHRGTIPNWWIKCTSSQMLTTKIGVLLVLVAVISSGCGQFGPRVYHRLASEEEAGKALEFAMTQLGAPYQWGGRRPPAFDSSGIITWAYRQAIPDIEFQVGPGRTEDDGPHRLIYQYNFHPLPLEDLVPGDLVYITNGTAEVTHGAMFVEWVKPLEVMRFLDASSRVDPTTGREIGVTIQEWPVHKEVRGQRFVAAGRLKVARTK